MGVNASIDLSVEELIARQARLLNEVQALNLAGSWESEPNDDYYFWSDSMFMLHGLSPTPDNRISVDKADKLIHKDDLSFVQQIRKELAQGGYVDYYFRLVTPDGITRHVRARENKIERNGHYIIQGRWEDERREREREQPLRDKAERQAIQLRIFERAEEVSQVGSWLINLETFETFYSDNVYRIYGLAPQTIPPHIDSFRKFIHPDDKAIVLKAYERAYIELIPVHLEYRIIREDGEVRYISQVSHLLKNEKGEHVLSGNTRDTTYQKLLEMQVKESHDLLSLYNELFVQAEQIGKMGTWQVNLQTRKNVYSDNVYRIFGLKPQSIPAAVEHFLQYIHPDDRQMVMDAYRSIFDEHVPFEITYRIIRADGRPGLLRNKSKIVKNSAGESLMIGVLQDVTMLTEKDRLLKETSERLALRNESFRHTESIAGIGNWTWDLDTNELLYSDSVYAIYGLKPQSISPGFKNFGKYIHPDDRQRMKDMHAKVRQHQEPMIAEYRIIRPDGMLRYLRGRSQPITAPDGRTIIIGTTQDVTDEVLIKLQLEEKIQFAEMLSDSIVDRIMVTDISNNIIGWNESCEVMYKRDKESVLGENIFDVFPMIKTPDVLDRFKRALNGETIHIPMQRSAELPGYHELFMVPIKNEQGNVIAVIHILHDVTSHKELQEQLAARLQFIEKLLESSVDRIIVLDKDLYFQLWNKQCEKYYGLVSKDVVGKNILEVFPRVKSDPLQQHCLRALGGETVHVPADDRAGMSGCQESYFIPLKNESKEITGLLWIIHDLTERFRAEEQL